MMQVSAGEFARRRTIALVIEWPGILGVMSSYNDYDSIPVTGSHYWLTERLRDDFGFKGYVVSDSASVEYLYTKHRVAADMKDGC